MAILDGMVNKAEHKIILTIKFCNSPIFLFAFVCFIVIVSLPPHHQLQPYHCKGQEFNQQALLREEHLEADAGHDWDLLIVFLFRVMTDGHHYCSLWWWTGEHGVGVEVGQFRFKFKFQGTKHCISINVLNVLLVFPDLVQ